jgi:hypothetical protein
MMAQAIRSSETSVLTTATLRNIPADRILQGQYRFTVTEFTELYDNEAP